MKDDGLRSFEAETLSGVLAEMSETQREPKDARLSLETLKLIAPIVEASAHHRAANSLESIAKSLEQLAHPPIVVGEDPERAAELDRLLAATPATKRY